MAFIGIAYESDIEQNHKIGVYCFSGIYLLGIFLFGIPIRYIFMSDYLLIKCGMLLYRKIPYSRMKSFESCRIYNFKHNKDSDEPISSTDCIKIYIHQDVQTKYIFSRPIKVTSGKDYFIVSPKLKKDFIEELKLRVNENKTA